MNKLCCFILLLNFKICIAQNIVPNGDFEQYSGCPTNFNQINSALFWFNPCVPPYGSSPGQSGSSDYYNACAPSGIMNVPNSAVGYQPSHSGSAYAGIYTFSINHPDFREYIEVQLINVLIANECYYFEMFINLSNLSQFATDTISAYFSDTVVTGIHSHSPFQFMSQVKNISGIISDTLNWTKVSGTFIAAGGESYLIIGNQNNDLHTDTISVNNTGRNFSYIFIDDVSLIPCNSIGIEEQTTTSEIISYPNPIVNNLNITINNNELSEIILYDITSRIILNREFTNSILINTEQLSKGIYFYEIKNKYNLKNKKEKVVKD